MLQLTATARGGNSLLEASAFHDAKCRHRLHAESLCEVRTLVHRDADQLEGVVVVPMLQHLRNESVDSAAAARSRREEQDELRLGRRVRCRVHHDAFSTWRGFVESASDTRHKGVLDLRSGTKETGLAHPTITSGWNGVDRRLRLFPRF